MFKKILSINFSVIIFIFIIFSEGQAQWELKWSNENITPSVFQWDDEEIGGIITGDFDGDNNPEIVIYSTMFVAILNSLDGSLLFEIDHDASFPHVKDIDNDSRDELIITGYEGTFVYEFKGGTSLGNYNQESKVPNSAQLSQNYPNPFNPKTNIKYTIKQPGPVEILIFNELGQKVRTLINGQYVVPGNYSVEWNGKNDNSNTLPSGNYFYQIRTGDFTSTKKAVIIK